MKHTYKLLKLCICLSFLTACQKSSSWHLSHLENSDIQYSSSKLRHLRANNYNGIELEFLSMDEEVCAFLNVFSTKIPALKKDPLKSSVIFYMDGIKYKDRADRLQGGQRLRLSEERTSWLVKQLSEGKSVKISLAGYTQEIDAKSFPEIYHQFSADKRSAWNVLLDSWNSILRGPL